MRGITLFARNRRWPAVIMVTVVAAVAIAVFGGFTYTPTPRSQFSIDVALQLPVAPAIAIAVCSRTLIPQQEQSSVRRVGRWQLLHVLGLAGLASILLGLAGLTLGAADYSSAAIVRNLLGLTGAALIGVASIGPRLGWSLALAWLIVPFAFVEGPQADWNGIATMVAQPDQSFGAWNAAVVAFLAGTILTSRNARDF